MAAEELIPTYESRIAEIWDSQSDLGREIIKDLVIPTIGYNGFGLADFVYHDQFQFAIDDLATYGILYARPRFEVSALFLKENTERFNGLLGIDESQWSDDDIILEKNYIAECRFAVDSSDQGLDLRYFLLLEAKEAFRKLIQDSN